MKHFPALTIAITIACAARADWVNLPAPTQGAFSVVAAVQELVDAVQERRYAEAWTNAPAFTSVVYRTTDNSYPVAAGSATNWYYAVETNTTNRVTIENFGTALKWVDEYIDSSKFSDWMDCEQAADIDGVLEDAITTNWCWYDGEDDGPWYRSSTNWRSSIAQYWPMGENFIDSSADEYDWSYPLRQAGAGADLTYTTSVNTVTSSVAGWEAGDYGLRSTTRVTVETNVVTWYEPTLMPERAFPSDGLTLLRFVYKPTPWKSSVAFYPTSVLISTTAALARGSYAFAGYEDVETFDGTRASPMYSCATCGGYRVVLRGEGSFFGFNWSLRVGTNVAAESWSASVHDYARGGRLQTYAEGIGSNVMLSCPPMSGSNWWVEECWVQQDVSALVDGASWIPYSNRVPPVWRAKSGSTNWSDFLPFDATTMVTTLYNPYRVATNCESGGDPGHEWTNCVTNLIFRASTTQTWSFSAAGDGPTNIGCVVNAYTYDDGYSYVNQGWTRPVGPNGAGRIVLISDGTHLGDEVALVWTQRTGIYGRWVPEFVGYLGRTLGRRTVWPEAINDRWEIVRRLRYRMGKAWFVRETAEAGLSNACCGAFGVEQSEACGFGYGATLWNGLPTTWVTSGVAEWIYSSFDIGGRIRYLVDPEDEEWPSRYDITRHARMSLQRGRPYAPVSGLVTAQTARFFIMVDDARVWEGCPPELTNTCEGSLWDTGTGGRFVSFSSSAGRGEFLADGTWGIASSSFTMRNAGKPASAASCWDEPESWFNFGANGVGTVWEPVEFCGDEGPFIGVYAASEGAGGDSGRTHGLYLLDMKFNCGDP